nr:glycine--tRNA ligase subunit beta [Alphaproteobacteria bacterium]
LKANNITLEDCEIRQLAGAKNKVNETYFWLKQLPPRSLAEILPDMIQQAIIKLPHPKSMRFTQGDFKFIRPLRAIMAYFNGQALKATFDYQGLLIAYTDHAVGNYMSKPNSKIMPKDFADYQEQLAQNDVVLSQQARLAVITDALAGQKLNHALINEVAGLCEKPVPLIGKFDKKFLNLPDFLLESVLNHHQKHFLLRDTDGKPTGEFLFFSNGERADDNIVIQGNQRVLQARLSDALFFVEQDLKQPVTERIEMLENLTFHPKLGSMARRVEHIKGICLALLKEHDEYPHITKANIKRVCELCKSDLPSLTVREFPALQGKMAGYYAEQAGENKELVTAIAQHYLPVTFDDVVPNNNLGQIVSLADKIDVLAGFFAINELPTGSKDPFAVRRNALAIINLLQQPVEDNVRKVSGYSSYVIHALEQWAKDLNITINTQQITNNIIHFINDRLIVKLKQNGQRYDIVEAICNSSNCQIQPIDNPVILGLNARLLRDFCNTDAGNAMLAVVKRVNNIITTEEKKQGHKFIGDITPDLELLEEDEEVSLYKDIIEFDEIQRDFFDKLKIIAQLRPVVDAFFDNVLINADDPKIRINRINLLLMFRNELRKIADFSLIQQ